VREQTFEYMERRFRAAIATAAGIDATRFNRPGTVIAPDSDRDGSQMAVIYRIGELSLVWCDSTIADRVQMVADDTAPFPTRGLAAWASANGGVYVGGAWSHLVVPDEIDVPPIPPRYTWRALDGDRVADRDLIEGLAARCDDEDIDEAELEMDDLDPLIIGALNGEGRLVGEAGARPWDADEGFGDIGVLVDPSERRLGLGAGLVARLCGRQSGTRWLPLYRCNFDRAASRRLALSIGFQEVSSLEAVRFE
jgi:GNAT superfamily N-acetyltransferase